MSHRFHDQQQFESQTKQDHKKQDQDTQGRDNQGRDNQDSASFSHSSRQMKNVAIREIDRLKELCSIIQGTPGLNNLNRNIVSAIERSLDDSVPHQDIDSHLQNHKSLLFFCMLNQSYLSPAPEGDHSLALGGIVRISGHVKYLRSEVNTPMFGEAYDRNSVVLMSERTDPFRDLAAQYICYAPSKHYVSTNDSSLPLHELIQSEPYSSAMLYKAIEPLRVASCLQEVETLLKDKQFKHGIYLSFEEKQSEETLETLKELITQNGSAAQILVEQPYDPFDEGSGVYRKVSFLHNDKDPLRYQLVQDAASMGFRPTLESIAHYYYNADRITSFLEHPDKEVQTIESFLQRRKYQDIDLVSEDLMHERELFQSLIEQCKDRLASLHLSEPIHHSVGILLKDEIKQLESVLNNDADANPVLSSTHVYQRMRTLLQTCAYMDALETEDTERIESIATKEKALFLPTNSGMTAVRCVTAALADSVEEIYSGDHYWETDFLVENAFSHNPHYPEIKPEHDSAYTHIPSNASGAEIERYVERIVANNSLCTHGQLLLFDASVSPFFYTRQFDLHALTNALAEQSSRLENPVYLIVDNTLDFDTITASTLFPDGIPEQVYLIFTPSHAKLFQLGFDACTGGAISIHAHDTQSPLCQSLYTRCKELLEEEQGFQTSTGLSLLDSLYFNLSESEKESYLSFMKERRQRNTELLVACLQSELEPLLSEYRHGDYSITPELSFYSPDGVKRDLNASFQFDPETRLHIYFKLLETPSDSYIAGPLFEALKSRVFEWASEAGIPLANGTSWGFTQTRMDWYMHTMRIAVGLEDIEATKKLGHIIGSSIRECIDDPEAFLADRRRTTLSDTSLEVYRDNIIDLDSFIPRYDAVSDLTEYEKDHPQKERFSSLIVEQGKAVSLLLAYEKEIDGTPCIYLSKAASAPETRGKGYFKKMLHHLIDEAKEAGYSRVVLQTSASPKNSWVVEAYQRCGFHVSDFQAEFLDNGWPLIMTTMELSLDDTQQSPMPYRAVPDEAYQKMKDTGSLEALDDHRRLLGIIA